MHSDASTGYTGGIRPVRHLKEAQTNEKKERQREEEDPPPLPDRLGWEAMLLFTPDAAQSLDTPL